jgi:hypothetical protein
MSSQGPEEIAQAWLTLQRHWWAYVEVCHLCEQRPHEALALICRLAELADTSELVGNVGAGPLEDLLRAHGAAVIDELEARARGSATLRAALARVWVSDPTSELGRRLVRLGCKPPQGKPVTDA